MWIDDSSVKFSCTGCGKCCGHEPGYVFLSKEDISLFCKKLELNRKEFLQKYCRKVGSKISLLEKKNYDCVFLVNNQCSVYDARPKQCRTYPFWDEVIRSKQSWQEEAKSCEGINHADGEIITKDQITKWREQ